MKTKDELIALLPERLSGYPQGEPFTSIDDANLALFYQRAVMEEAIRALCHPLKLAQHDPSFADDAPYCECWLCGRKSWDKDSAHRICGMTQPDGRMCAGSFSNFTETR